MTDTERVQKMIEIQCAENPRYREFINYYYALFEEGMPAWCRLLEVYKKRYGQ